MHDDVLFVHAAPGVGLVGRNHTVFDAIGPFSEGRAAIGEIADSQAFRIREGDPDHLFARVPHTRRHRVIHAANRLPQFRGLQPPPRADTLHQCLETGDLHVRDVEQYRIEHLGLSLTQQHMRRGDLFARVDIVLTESAVCRHAPPDSFAQPGVTRILRVAKILPQGQGR